MNNFLKDVVDQPESLRKSLEIFLSGGGVEQMKKIDGHRYEKILFTGMGSSHYCSCGASIHLNQNGYLSMVMSASQVLHYEMNLINEKTLLVLVSQSGESGEIVKLIEKLPNNITVVAVTNNPDSTLGKRGNHIFLLNVADEEAVSTRTYLSSILLMDMLAKALTGQLDEEFLNKIRKSIDDLEAFLKKQEEVTVKMKNLWGVPPYLCVIGRGYSLSSVHSGALFIREVAKYPSIDFDSGEFRHGPFEMIDAGFHAMIFAPKGPTYELNCGLARNIAQRGGKAVLVTNQKTELDHPNILVLEQNTSDEMLAPISEIVPIQLFGSYVAEAKNLKVGTFRWSSKITNVE